MSEAKLLKFHLHAAGVLAPGLSGFDELLRVCRGDQRLDPRPLILSAPERLPAAERRRSSHAARLALACAAQAVAASPFDPAMMRAVFSSDEGTGEVCKQMLEALTTSHQVSPLLFANSVHNAPSGYFSIAWSNRQSISVVSLGEDSFACGLLCAATDARVTAQPVLLVVSDPVLPEPLDELLPIACSTAASFILTAKDGPPDATAMASFTIVLRPSAGEAPSELPGWMPAAWRANPSAKAIAAIALLAQPSGTEMKFALGPQILSVRRD